MKNPESSFERRQIFHQWLPPALSGVVRKLYSVVSLSHVDGGGLGSRVTPTEWTNTAAQLDYTEHAQRIGLGVCGDHDEGNCARTNENSKIGTVARISHCGICGIVYFSFHSDASRSP